MIRILLRTLLGFALFFVLFTLSFWFFPEVYLNPVTLRWGLDRAGLRESLRWDALAIEFPGAEKFSRHVLLKGSGITYADKSGNEADVKNLELEFVLDLGLPSISVRSVPRVLIDARKFILAETPPEPDTEPKDYALDLRIPKPNKLLPEILQESQIGWMAVNLDEFSIEGVKGKATLRSVEGDTPTEKRLKGEGNILLDGAEITTDFLLLANFHANTFSLDANTDARLGPHRLKGKTEAKWAESFHAKFDLIWKERKKPVRPVKLDLWQEESRFRIEAAVDSPAIPGLPIDLARVACTVSGDLHRELGEPQNLELNCPFQYKLRRNAGIYLVNQKAWDGELGLHTSLKRRQKQLTFNDSRLVLRTKTKEFALETEFRGSVDADLEDFTFNNLRLDDLDGKADVTEFGWVVRSLEGSKWAVPAPFRTLRGPIKGTLTGDPRAGGFGLAANVDFDLKDARQVFRAVIDASTEIPTQSLTEIGPELRDGKIRVAAAADFRDVALELPRLDPTSLPPILPDGRFSRDAAEKDDGGVQVDIALKNSEKPIRLYTNLLPTPIALHLDYRLPGGKESHGKITVDPMDATFFRRKVHVERMALSRDQKTGTTNIDGVLTYSTSEVLIRAYLIGPIASPRVEFESDPPLSRDQIVSVLVFNSSLDDLSEENQRSATSLGQALGSGAFSLTAMYLLASTPIESVQFDPVTRTYSARVRIDRTTTLRLGSNAPETQNYGIGKRIGRRFSVQTELERSPERTNTVSTMLKWFLRY